MQNKHQHSKEFISFSIMLCYFNIIFTVRIRFFHHHRSCRNPLKNIYFENHIDIAFECKCFFSFIRSFIRTITSKTQIHVTFICLYLYKWNFSFVTVIGFQCKNTRKLIELPAISQMAFFVARVLKIKKNISDAVC